MEGYSNIINMLSCKYLKVALGTHWKSILVLAFEKLDFLSKFVLQYLTVSTLKALPIKVFVFSSISKFVHASPTLFF